MQIRPVFITVSLLMMPLIGQTQAWKWANSLGNPNTTTAVKSIRKYAGTGVLLSGSFAAPALDIGGYALNNAGQDDGYVAIADDAGQYNWAASFGGSGRDFAVDAAAAPNGDFVVAGNFNSISMNIGGVSLFNSGETDAFVVKYNQDKTLAWAKKIGTADIDEASSVTVDAEGNTYISGHVLDKLTLSSRYIFVRKLDAAGNLVWERKGNAQDGILKATALALDDNQDIYLAGTLYGTSSFSGINLTNDTSAAAFIVKYNASGALLKTYLNPNLNKFNGLQVRGNMVYGCGEKSGYCFGWGWPLSDSKTHVLKLDANLNAVWHKTAGGEAACQSLDIAQNLSVDEVGNVYVTGYFFSSTLSFAGQALPNSFNIEYYYPQIFVFKYAPDGDELWGKSLGGIHSDEATSILATGDDTFYLGGNFESNPATFGAHNLTNTSTLDSIYVHLRPGRYGRKTMGFLAVFDKEASDTNPEPVVQDVVLFPNPTSGHLTVRLKSAPTSPFVFQLTATDGRLLRQTTYMEGTTELQEDLTALPPGVYFVTLSMKEGVFISKLLKTK